MKRTEPWIAITLAALLLVPAVSLAKPQEPPDERTGGLAKTDDALAPLESRNDRPALSQQDKAINAYNRGLEHRDKAWKLEEQAAAAEGEKAAKKAAKAQKSYKEAIRQFRMAVEQVPNFHQALGGLGYALLKTEQYEEALDAYDRALTIGPRYPEAIQERGEAYLGLDRIEEAKGAYTQLFPVDRKCAGELMTAMKRWLDERSIDADELSAETIEGFATWIEERSKLAAHRP